MNIYSFSFNTKLLQLIFHSSHLLGRSPANAHTWAGKTDHGDRTGISYKSHCYPEFATQDFLVVYKSVVTDSQEQYFYYCKILRIAGERSNVHCFNVPPVFCKCNVLVAQLTFCS